MSKLQSTTISSPIGKLYLLARDETVLGLNLSGFHDLLSTLSPQELEEKINQVKRIQNLSDKLLDYFDGDLRSINSIKVRQPGGEFSQAAWSAMRRIKAGTVDSYADLAHNAGSPAAVRAAGSACAKNKIILIVPCHRVVKTGGAIGNYGPGVDKKIWLLRHEGAID
jgi:methylated-DNA-[protein]-cysteine S-methyltransferase